VQHSVAGLVEHVESGHELATISGSVPCHVINLVIQWAVVGQHLAAGLKELVQAEHAVGVLVRRRVEGGDSGAGRVLADAAEEAVQVGTAEDCAAVVVVVLGKGEEEAGGNRCSTAGHRGQWPGGSAQATTRHEDPPRQHRGQWPGGSTQATTRHNHPAR
jgi:hypothetical protein